MRISDMPLSDVFNGQETIPLYDPNQSDPAQRNRQAGILLFKGIQGVRGYPGLSAYEIWLNNGNSGTQQDYIDSISGTDGTDGAPGDNGLSSYQIWLDIGNTGTEEDFIESLQGQSSYQLWLNLGNTGTPVEFLNTLRGPQGISAYETWRALGNVGTPTDFIIYITGKSAYQTWQSLNNVGSAQDFINSLKGAQGDQGLQGIQGIPGPHGGFTYNGTTPPNIGIGEFGDYYLNISNGDYYGPKTSGGWGAPIINIRGPQGLQGNPGSQGTIWYTGAGAPNLLLGNNNDYYLNSTNSDVYTKTAGAWNTPVANIRGQQGIQGNPGDATFTTGDVKFSLKINADSGWVLGNDTTIGNAGSGATQRAHADTQALYVLLWTNMVNTYAPVTGGRGSSAAADFAANKPIQLTYMAGRALAARGLGLNLSNRALGQNLGEETHASTFDEMAPHRHYMFTNDTNDLTLSPVTQTSFASNSGGDQEYSLNGSTLAATIGLTGITGNGLPHNNMQPTIFLTVMIKL